MSQPSTQEINDNNENKRESTKTFDRIEKTKTMSQGDSASQLNGLNNHKIKSESDGKL